MKFRHWQILSIYTLLVGGLLGSCRGNKQPSHIEMYSSSSATDTLTLIFAGDVMAHLPQTNAAKISSPAGGSKQVKYSFNSCFEAVKPYIKRADIAVVNLETPLAGPPYSGYPLFSAPDELADALRDAGIDIVALANNHILDRWSSGAARTLKVLHRRKLLTMGTFQSMKDAEEYNPLVLDVKSFRLAILNYTYGTNSFSPQKPLVVNYIDTAAMRKAINKAKQVSADVIIAFLHWGIEGSKQVSQEQKALAKWLDAAGVRIIIGAHPHVVQPIEARLPQTFKAYSLGNFISNQHDLASCGGLMLELKLTKKDDSVRIAGYTPIDVWVDKMYPSKNRYRILPIKEGHQLLKQPSNIRPESLVELEKYKKVAF